MAKTYLSKLYEKMEESRMDRLSDTSKKILAQREKKQVKKSKARRGVAVAAGSSSRR
jgi:hypothetical protein